MPPLREMCFAICGCHGEEITEEYSVFLAFFRIKNLQKSNQQFLLVTVCVYYLCMWLLEVRGCMHT